MDVVSLIKWLVVLGFGIVIPGLVVMTSMADRRWTRVWLVLLIALSIRFPVLTIDFHHGFRHNVRGWEICWSDYIALGLIAVRLVSGGLPRFGVIGLLWAAHLVFLGLSAMQGLDLEFSAFYIFRQFRGALVLIAVASTLRSREDLQVLIVALALLCLWNEASVLRQKYREGRFQCPGAFDHQNAMAMAMILCGPIMLGALVLQAVRGKAMLITALGLMAASHSVLASLSRAGMLVYGAACAMVLGLSLLNGLNGRKLAWCGGFVMLGIVGVIIMLPTLMLRFGDKTANKASHRTREVMNEAAMLMHQHRPWLGVGPNNYAEAVNYLPYSDLVDESIREKGHKIDPDYRRGIVESHYMQMRAEGGWLGYGSFMAVIVASLVAALGRALLARDPAVRAWAMGALAGLIGNYLQSQFEHTLVNYTNLYIWMTLAGGLAATPLRGDRHWGRAAAIASNATPSPAAAASQGDVPTAAPAAVPTPAQPGRSASPRPSHAEVVAARPRLPLQPATGAPRRVAHRPNQPRFWT